MAESTQFSELLIQIYDTAEIQTAAIAFKKEKKALILTNSLLKKPKSLLQKQSYFSINFSMTRDLFS